MTRIRCLVPYCRCSRRPDPDIREWICAKHWKMIPREIKATRAQRRREARRIVRRKPTYREYWKLPAGSADRLAAVGLWRRLDMAWRACKVAAIEAAAGIT